MIRDKVEESPHAQPVRFLIYVVAVDVVIAAVLRSDRINDLLTGQRDWRSWLGLLAAVYLLVVAIAVARVARSSTAMHSSIRRRDRALAAHAETSSDWLWETTPDMIVTYCSPKVEALLGYAPDDVIGRDAHDLMSGTSARQSREALASGLARQGWHDVRSEWLHAEGHLVPLLHSGVPIADDDGDVLGYRGSGRAAEQDQQSARLTSELRQRVLDTIERADLRMALQPIISVHTGRLVGVEALARFGDGRRPDGWFEDAGKVGLRTELEMLAVRLAMQRLPELPPDVFISINACPEVILDPRFSDMLLNAPDCPLDRIMIEITEHVRIEEYGPLATSLGALRDAGARLAVDDAGAGYASLSHILRLHPDNIKLDRSIVAGVDDDRARRTLITALVLLAIDIGSTVTAEGIETAAELEAIASLGVDHAQGYLIARPSIDMAEWPAALLA